MLSHSFCATRSTEVKIDRKKGKENKIKRIVNDIVNVDLLNDKSIFCDYESRLFSHLPVDGSLSTFFSVFNS